MCVAKADRGKVEMEVLNPNLRRQVDQKHILLHSSSQEGKGKSTHLKNLLLGVNTSGDSQRSS